MHIKKGTKFKMLLCKDVDVPMLSQQCILLSLSVGEHVCYMLALQGLHESFYSQTSHLTPNSFGILFKRTRGVYPIFPRMLGRMLGAVVL